MPNRWFEQEQVAMAARNLMTEAVESCKVTSTSKRARYSERRLKRLNLLSNLFLVGVVAFIAAVLFLPGLLPGDWLAKDGNHHEVVKWIIAIVPIGLGVRAKQRLKRANKRTQGHESCIQSLVNDHPTLRNTRHSPILGDAVNVLPYFPGGISKSKARTHCNLFGEYRGCALAMLESEYQSRDILSASQSLDKLQAQLL